MGQEFLINSLELENKINQLLPSQGGEGAGVDLSASTQIIPIIDLTETAEGSALRADLQSSMSHNTTTVFNVTNTTTTIQNTPGYYRVLGTMNLMGNGTALNNSGIFVNDGATAKNLFGYANNGYLTGNVQDVTPYDFLIYLDAGDSIQVISEATTIVFIGSSRQIATNAKVLVNP